MKEQAVNPATAVNCISKYLTVRDGTRLAVSVWLGGKNHCIKVLPLSPPQGIGGRMPLRMVGYVC